MMSIGIRFTGLAPRILGAARILVGVMFTCHGVQKIFGVFGGVPPGVPGIVTWGAGSIELAGGLLITIGLFTRIAAFICSGQMAVAYFAGHFPHGFWPIVNGGELAIVYCWLFLYIAAQGPGAWAIDKGVIHHRGAENTEL